MDRGLFMSAKHILFISLCLGTLCGYYLVDRYNEVGGQLLVNNYFSEGLEGWLVSGSTTAEVVAETGLLRIKTLEEKASVFLSQGLSPSLKGEEVVLKGVIKSVDIQGGREGWEQGQVLLLQNVEDKPVYSVPHVLVTLAGTNDWTEYSLVTAILPEATEVRVYLQLQQCTGELQAKGLTLFRVQENPQYRMMAWLVFGAWALFLVGMYVPAVIGRYEENIWSVLVVLVIIAIVIGTTVPGVIKNEVKDEIVRHAKVYTDETVEYGGRGIGVLTDTLKAARFQNIDITKVAHFLLFGLLGGLLHVRRQRGSKWQTVVDIGILACGSELVQLYAKQRNALVSDVIIDIAGALCAILVLEGTKHLRGGVRSTAHHEKGQ